MMDFDVAKTTRICAVTEREIAAGEMFYTALLRDGADVKRRDYSADAWPGPPENTIAWWKSKMPERDGSKKQKLAPSEVLLRLFAELAEVPERSDWRYVLTLLLIRRRLMRLEETIEEDGREVLVLYCHRDEQTYRVPVVEPDAARVEEIQAYLAELLYAQPAGANDAKQPNARNDNSNEERRTTN